MQSFAAVVYEYVLISPVGFSAKVLAVLSMCACLPAPSHYPLSDFFYTVVPTRLCELASHRTRDPEQKPAMQPTPLHSLARAGIHTGMRTLAAVDCKKLALCNMSCAREERTFQLLVLNLPRFVSSSSGSLLSLALVTFLHVAAILGG